MPSFETSGIPRRDRRRGDPAVGRVCFLPERVARGTAVSAQLGIDRHERGAAVNDLDPRDLRFQLEHPRVAPAPADRAVAELGSRLKRDDCRPSGDERGVALRKARPTD
jgi:hypothetical protein